MTSSHRRRSFSFDRASAGAGAIGLLLLMTAGCDSADALCQRSDCSFTEVEWTRLSALAGLGPPAADPANRLTDPANRGDADPAQALDAAERLGQMFYHDPRFSGVATQVDISGRRMAQPARAPIGQPIMIACVTCHDLRAGGIDVTSVPGHVSVGAGWYDVNAQSTINAAQFSLKYWNGRYESLVWQIIAVAESTVSMNGTRLAVAWTINDYYRNAYNAVFGDEFPFPEFGRTADEQAALLEADGQCRLVAGVCPTGNDCRVVDEGCWPRWPLTGKPDQAGFERMSEEDQTTITRVYVNWAKAIAAFEFRLTSGTAPFDRWIRDPDGQPLSASAQRGARLFVGKASCIECHNTPLFSDGHFYNVGVPQRGVGVPTEAECTQDGPCLAHGWYQGLQVLQNAGTRDDLNRRFRNDSPWSDNPEDPTGQPLYDLPVTDDLRGSWRTPSLRQVSQTAPYMHNGFYRSLEEVVRHYNQGGTQEGSASQFMSKRIRPLGLTNQEISDLVAFLESLTAERFAAEELAEEAGEVLDLRTPPSLPPDRN